MHISRVFVSRTVLSPPSPSTSRCILSRRLFRYGRDEQRRKRGKGPKGTLSPSPLSTSFVMQRKRRDERETKGEKSSRVQRTFHENISRVNSVPTPILLHFVSQRVSLPSFLPTK